MALRIGMQSRERAKLCLSTQEDQARDVNIAGTNLLVTYHTINQNQAKKIRTSMKNFLFVAPLVWECNT